MEVIFRNNTDFTSECPRSSWLAQKTPPHDGIVLRTGENLSTWRKTSRSQGKNQQQTQANPTRAILSALTTAAKPFPLCILQYSMKLQFTERYQWR